MFVKTCVDSISRPEGERKMAESILKKRMGIENEIDDFLNQVSEAGLLCKSGMDAYLKGNMDAFVQAMTSIRNTEHRGDALRRSIEHDLYKKTLIPESRGDVMELLEDMDALLDRFTGLIWQFEIERPDICPEFHEDYRELLLYSVESVEADVRSCRAFFKDIHAVDDHIHKVIFWEKESDKVSTRLQRAIFGRQDLRLSHKMHLRFFVKQVDRIADEAEDVADRLNIYVIKRML
jgi:predicted phosphate transport protein (TIGR00153 family)